MNGRVGWVSSVGTCTYGPLLLHQEQVKAFEFVSSIDAVTVYREQALVTDGGGLDPWCFI